MKIFELQSGQPTITTEALLIPQFLDVYNSDKSKDKDIAYKQLTYIYFSSDYKSIYLSYDQSIREEMLKKDFIGDTKWKPTKEVLAAIDKYKELQRTPTMRFLEDNQSAMESMGEYFRNIDWEETDQMGKPKYDITKVTNAVKQAGGIIDNIEKLKEKVAKEQAMNDSKARGQGTGGLMEF